MTRRVTAWILASLLWLLPVAGLAQDLATLVADEIRVDPAGRVTATGNVEVFYQGTRLTAQAISYERAGDRLTITGPIVISDGSSDILMADSAELDRDLRTGILRSARLVLDRQLQLAAQQIARVGDRYTRLDRVVASSCEVCADNPTPLWEIRASRVVHDQEARQLYFENAQLRLAGIPVLYLPRLRLPDPSLPRASGFLIPQLRTSSSLGTGLKLPYFVTLGAHADATLTPYLSSSTRTLELRYRQELRGGSILAEGAFSNDDVSGSRAYLFAEAGYRLPRGFQALAKFEFVSDPGYLFLYDYSDKDRLTNTLEITRVRDKDRFRVGITDFKTLRESEIPIRDTLPDRFFDIFYEREIPALSFGGRTVASLDATALNRPSSADIDGRDVSRIGAALDWRRESLFGPGIIGAAELGLRVDAYNIGQDSTYDLNLTRIVPRGAVELRWPLARMTAAGSRDVIEPILHVDVAEASGDAVPLEDSRIVEFDEANLFSASRYPGSDGVETGTRVAAGLTWRHLNHAGWRSDLAVGRVVNLSGDLGFGEGSGLEGDRSEWLVAGRFALNEDIWLISRSTFDEKLNFTQSETRVDWAARRFDLATSYVFARPEPAEDRFEQLSEWTFEGSYDLSDVWTARADWRYDFSQGRAARSGVGLGYRNDCIDVSLSLSRRYVSSTSVDTTTDFGFRVSLLGVGGRSTDADKDRNCKG